MSTERIDRERAGWVDRKKRPVGPNGRPLCRYCDQEIEDRKRRTFCSDACVQEHRIRTDPGFVREQVFKRDRGVCASCGLDTTQIDVRIKQLANLDPSNFGAYGRAARHVKQELGIPLNRQTYWDADHIVPVIKGGGACGLENYRTLCVPCHRAETARLAAARASERRLVKEESVGIQRLPLEST